MIMNPIKYPGYDYMHHSDSLQRTKLARIFDPCAAEHCDTAIYLLHPFATNRFFWSNYFHKSVDHKNIFVLPESGRRWLINDNDNNLYENYFMRELIPAVTRQFPWIQKHVIGGFSMGGATAFFLALKYPHFFHSAFSIAGAFNAYDRVGDPYFTTYNRGSLIMPTEQEHIKVWGEVDSLTRKEYNIENLIEGTGNCKTNFVFEVGLQDHDRIIAMNRHTNTLFKSTKMRYIYNEYAGDHSTAYAYRALNRILNNLQ